MAITFFGVASIPSDNGTNTTNPTVFSNPPIASMQEGDLIITIAWARASGFTPQLSVGGGQTWNPGTGVTATSAILVAAYYWCRFNGTWTAAPEWTFGGSTINNNAIMLVFRTDKKGTGWELDPGITPGWTNQAVASSFTITGWTPVNPFNICVGASFTDDDNTWNISGSNWIRTGLSNQYRNTSGQDASGSFAYQIQSTPAATNNLTMTEATLGNDGGFTFSICIYEQIPGKIYQIKQAIKRSNSY